MNKLMAAAVAVFEAYPEAEAVFVCDDGNVFLEERQNLAENHCRTERLSKPTLVRRDELGQALGNSSAPDDSTDPRTELERRADDEAQLAAAAEAEAKAKAEADQAAAEAEAKAKKEAAAKDKGSKKNGK